LREKSRDSSLEYLAWLCVEYDAFMLHIGMQHTADDE
jgi:hypothetical protein